MTDHRPAFICIVLLWVVMVAQAALYYLEMNAVMARLDDLKRQCKATEMRVVELERMFAHRTGEALP